MRDRCLKRLPWRDERPMKHRGPAAGRVGRTILLTLSLGLVVSLSLAPSGTPLGIAAASAAGPGEYSAPEWLPLRSEAEVSCVRTNCDDDDGSDYHGYWALDLADPGNAAGDPVFAAGAGQVRVVSISPDGECGRNLPSNTLEVDHGGGVTTRYYHLASFSVDGGAWVDRNTQIGVMGKSGFTLPCPPGGVHLHYEKRVGGANVDPGPLKACDGGTLKSYPESRFPSWDAIPALGGVMVSSSGTDCEVARPTCTDVAATVPQGGSTTIDLTCSGTSIRFEPPSAPAHGTIVNVDPDTVTYTPTADYSGSDEFKFTASNAGGTSDPATVRITVTPAPVVAPVPPPVAPAPAPSPAVEPPALEAPAPVCLDRPATIVASAGQTVIVGTAGPDVIVGSAAADRIDGLGGNDRICAGGGDDVVRGGRGNDRLSGAADDDLLLGGTGNDILLGGSGDDRTGGGAGWDYVNAGGGNDLLDERKLGGGGRDRLFGGSGIDRVRTNDSTADAIDCGADGDVLVSDRRADQQRGCERIRRT